MDKLYVIVRRDLPSQGAVVAQACHGMRAFAAAHPEVEKDWYDKSNNLVVLAADGESALADIATAARAKGLRLAEFREPDYGDTLTALALEPAAKPLLRRLPLAG